VEKGQIVKVSKDADGIVTRETLTQSWTDWIDYWAVDFNFENKREIVRVQDPATGEWGEVWTGDYVFENEWQSFPHPQGTHLELTSVYHECPPGRRKIAVKVVDHLWKRHHDDCGDQRGRQELVALPPRIPLLPLEIIDPAIRWFPADETLRETRMDQLMPPLVYQLRRKVQEWRAGDYAGPPTTSRGSASLVVRCAHMLPAAGGTLAEFRYYFSQREALETIIYLIDVVSVQDKYDLMRYDSSGLVSSGMFDETWRRLVLKMATGTGKTKVLSLVLAWSFFHKLYEPESGLARNFLVITPNIIVLDRISAISRGCASFFSILCCPKTAWAGTTGVKIFSSPSTSKTRSTSLGPYRQYLSHHIHRVYASDDLTPRPTTTTRWTISLATAHRRYHRFQSGSGHDRPRRGRTGGAQRRAHHIHDPRMAWFKSIEDINNRLKQKGGETSLQVDVTATPRHNDGAIFVQTVADYPLVEAIAQNSSNTRAARRRKPWQVGGTAECPLYRKVRRLYRSRRHRVRLAAAEHAKMDQKPSCS
jgi:hypothetical protein